MPTIDALTVTQAAALKGVTDAAIRSAIRRGRLPAFRLGKLWLVRPADLSQWTPRDWAPGKPRLKE